MHDPGNIDALVGDRVGRLRALQQLFMPYDRPHFAAAETTLTKAISVAPEHAWAHFCLGGTLIYNNRAARGTGERERALALDRNLPWPTH